MKSFWNLFNWKTQNEENANTIEALGAEKSESYYPIIKNFESLSLQLSNAQANKDNNNIKVKQIKEYFDEIASETNSSPSQNIPNFLDTDYEQIQLFIQAQQNAIKINKLKQQILEKKRIHNELQTQIQKAQDQKLMYDNHKIDEVLKYKIRFSIQERKQKFLEILRKDNLSKSDELAVMSKLFNNQSILNLEKCEVPYEVRNEFNLEKRIARLADIANK